MRKVAYALAVLLAATLLIEELRLADARSELEKRVAVLKRVEEHNQRLSNSAQKHRAFLA
jgi:hypothetical protein